jgi:hypothetical protein
MGGEGGMDGCKTEYIANPFLGTCAWPAESVSS